ncbi:hypothetical protein KEM56_006585 [Ascosphaera pollenicola]|nr:hypothetical protein KEM56_006585 [Ascosphaera pollenicola]
MAFSFNFASDDIEYDDAEDTVSSGVEHLTIDDESGRPQLFEAKSWPIDELLSSLPSTIYYNLLDIPKLSASSVTGQNESGAITVPRREIFDIRTQLMVEADLSPSDQKDGNEFLITGLEKGDLNPRVYEGGFKTWECALDLAKLLSRDEVDQLGDSSNDTRVIELGTGTGIPSLVLLQHLLTLPKPTDTPGRAIKFVFADYNSAVLRLVTLPNIILTWAHCQTLDNQKEGDNQQDGETKDGKDDQDHAHRKDQDLELDIEPELIKSFQDDLRARNIHLSFISGAWSPEFVDIAMLEERDKSQADGKENLLLLASETIYSPASLRAFSETLISLLQKRAGLSKSLIAAKKVYFGIGGGVDEFLSVFKDLEETNGHALRISEKLDVEDAGVGRLVLEIESQS